ncbi:MAG: hypothetical protein H0X26_06480 [Alphaproteobacteria bacterium]|nr:hypothetical protein [Alphaproteobacteria bacterium]
MTKKKHLFKLAYFSLSLLVSFAFISPGVSAASSQSYNAFMADCYKRYHANPTSYGMSVFQTPKKQTLIEKNCEREYKKIQNTQKSTSKEKLM